MVTRRHSAAVHSKQAADTSPNNKGIHTIKLFYLIVSAKLYSLELGITHLLIHSFSMKITFIDDRTHDFKVVENIPNSGRKSGLKKEFFL